jgi:hypothetical protein
MSTTLPGTRNAPAKMTGALRVFLDSLIDYAGLFPPAGLGMADAVTNFARYRTGKLSWVLSAFICPAQRLAELDGFVRALPADPVFDVSVLCSAGTDWREAEARLIQDLSIVEAYARAESSRIRPRAIEFKLPDSVIERGGNAVARLMAPVLQRVGVGTVGLDRLYVEVGFSGDWRRDVAEIVSTLARPPSTRPSIGIKVRCGGLRPDAFPTPEQLAFIIARCREARLPFKATAGLHHPVRHHDPELQVMQHGFLNVFGAGALARVLDLTEPALRQVLRSEQLNAFTFDDDGFAFQDLRISTAQLETARSDFAHSFGSCSFEEPLDDLQVAGFFGRSN